MQQRKTLLFCGEKADANFMRQLQECFDVIECKEKLYENFIKNQPSVVVADTKDNLIFEDVKEIKKISEIAVVVYTDNEDIVHKLVCFEIGVDEYILKKWDEREVLARIKAVCARSFKKRKKDEHFLVCLFIGELYGFKIISVYFLFYRNPCYRSVFLHSFKKSR